MQCNILHLEDDDNDSLFFQRVLGQLNFAGAYRRVATVDETIDYLSAVGKYSDRKLYPVPNVLVCDSAVSGVKTMADLLAWLKGQPQFATLATVMLSGGLSPTAQENWLKSGIAGILTKGASLTEFAASVEEILRRCVI